MKIFEIMCDRNRVHCGPGKEVSLPHLQEMRGGISPPYQWESKADFKVTHLHQWLYLQSNAFQLFLQITLLQKRKSEKLAKCWFSFSASAQMILSDSIIKFSNRNWFWIISDSSSTPRTLVWLPLFWRERYWFYFLTGVFLLRHTVFSGNRCVKKIIKKWPFVCVSDGGRVCALLLPDQKEWKL